MYDTELDSLLRQADIATSRLAEINSSTDPKVIRHKGQVCRQLSAINSAIARRYAQVYLTPQRPMKPCAVEPNWHLQALLCSIGVTAIVVFIGVMGHAWFQAFAASFASMARPVP